MPTRDPSLADLVRFFFSENKSDSRALTLARMEHLTDSIADGRFIASTPAADAIYGRKMDGSEPVWISTMQPLEMFLLGRRMWAARQIDSSIPTEYLTDIEHPNGQLVSVHKSTQEFVIDGVRYWLTIVNPASDVPRIPHVRDIPITVDGLPAIGMAGKISMAEVMRSLEENKNALTEEDNTVRLGSVKDKIEMAGSNMELGTNTQAIPLTQSSTGKSQRPHYLHTCSECGGSWVGTSVDPPKCIFCASRLWRGFSKWDARKYKQWEERQRGADK